MEAYHTKMKKRERRARKRRRHMIATVITAIVCTVAGVFFHIELAHKGTEWLGAAIVYYIAFGCMEG